MATYKINGYNIFSEFSIVPDEDKSSADSFESLGAPEEVFSHDWGDGVIEYDLLSPVYIKPKTFIIKGTMAVDSIEEYKSNRDAVSNILLQNYVTLEQVDTAAIANAKLKQDGMQWHRLTNLDSDKILISVQFQFDQVMQDVPYKTSGPGPIINEGTLTVEYGDPSLTVVGGHQRVSIPYWLSGKTGYRVYSTQMNLYLRTIDISYNTGGYFDILIPGFRLKPGNQLIIWPYMLAPGG